jgi:hypothetical protein
MNQTAYAYLRGILYTDGCVSPKAKTSWRVVVSNNSAAIVDLFGATIRDCFGKAIRRSRAESLYVGILDSKEVGRFLIERHGTFRTEACRGHQGCPAMRGGRRPCQRCEPVHYAGVAYPPASLPAFTGGHEAASFLRAAFSCDGGVNLYVAGRAQRQRWLIEMSILPVNIRPWCGSMLRFYRG